MKHSGTTLTYALGLGFILSCAAAQAQDVLVVANKSVSISQISAAEIRGIFTGVHSRFSDGTRAIPVILKGGPAHEVFLKNYVGENPNEFRVRWRKSGFHRGGLDVERTELRSGAAAICGGNSGRNRIRQPRNRGRLRC